VAQIAAALGTPFMPWQQHVADIAFEIDPTTGEFAYREVRLGVPRQSGKTTLLLAVAVHRCLAMEEPQNVLYTAQNGVAARSKFIDDYLRVLARSPFSSLFTPRLTSGHEAIKWHNGSRFGITASTEKAGHGQVLDLGIMDEAFAAPDARTEQAFRPAMNTRRQPQLWIVSTAGTPEQSAYLLGKVTDGRERADRGETDTVAYFEWSAPDDADFRDEAVWWSTMPALGHTTPVEAIRAAAASMDSPAEFRRAYLNQWVTQAADDLALPLDRWDAALDPASSIVGSVSFAIDITPDRAKACIGAYGLNAEGVGHVEAVDHRDGVEWVVERMSDLSARWGCYEVAIDGAGPAASLIPALQEAGLEVRVLGTNDVTSACASLFDALMAGDVKHIGQPNLSASVAGAKRRPVVDRWAYGRKTSAADITPIVAVTFARHIHDGESDPGVWFV
jgi:hypothetical protein